jgi:ankyrin repeat protein
MLAADPGLRREHADLVPRYAEARKWAAVRLLVNLGFEVNVVTSDGATPLHHAAAAGELAIVRLLVEHGADHAAREPQFGAQPAGWAQYFKKRATQEYLESLA